MKRATVWVAATATGAVLAALLASPGLAPVAADYVHDWRTEGLSDHSAMWARVEAR